MIDLDPEMRACPDRVVEGPGGVDSVAGGRHTKRLADRSVKPGVSCSHTNSPLHSPVRPGCIFAAAVVNIRVVHTEMAGPGERPGRTGKGARPVGVEASVRDGKLAEARRQPIA